MEVTEIQFTAMARMCNSQPDGKYTTDIYTLTKLGEYVYQLQLGTSSSGVQSVCGIERGTKLPISIQSILRQLYNRYTLKPSINKQNESK